MTFERRKEKALFIGIIGSFVPKADAEIDVRGIPVKGFSRLPQISEKSGTIKNSIGKMSFHPFDLPGNMQKWNQAAIGINEAVCPSLQRWRLSASASATRPGGVGGVEEA